MFQKKLLLLLLLLLLFYIFLTLNVNGNMFSGFDINKISQI